MTGGLQQHNDEPALKPLIALVVSLIMPWRACRGAWQQMGLGLSLLVHIGGLAIFFIGQMMLDEVRWGGSIFRGLDLDDPAELAIFLIFAGVWVIGIELAYLFAALLTSCWGAAEETFGQSFGRSHRRWYQLTPFHAVWTLALIVAVHFIDEFQRNSYWDYELRSLFFSTIRLNAFLLYIGVGGWFTLRALAVPRSMSAYFPKSRWPALCETCGYAIVGLQHDQPCPECGRPNTLSLTTQRGSENKGTLAKMCMALFQPTALGESLPTRFRTKGPAKAIAITALALLASGPVGMAIIMLAVWTIEGDLHISGPVEFIELFVVIGLGIGLGAMTLGILITLAAGSLVGLVERVFGKRNTLAAACQATCYASGYTVALALMMYLFIAMLVLAGEYLFNRMGFGLAAFIPLMMLGVVLFLTLPHLVIIGRLTRAMRFANT